MVLNSDGPPHCRGGRRTIRRKLDIQLLKSLYIIVLCYESTDIISVTKTLVVYTHILDPDSFTASTHFLGNVKVHNGTATVITQALKELLQSDRGCPTPDTNVPIFSAPWGQLSPANFGLC